VVRVPEKLGQMDEDVANKLGYGGIAVGGNAAGLAVEVGRYGDGNVSDSGHGLFSSAGGIPLPFRTIVPKRERLSAKRDEKSGWG